MRIIKLSTKEFKTLDEVIEWFKNDLPSRIEPGMCQITHGRIAKDKLNPGEPLLFTFQSRVVFLARTASGLRANYDEYQVRYPYYFLVDMEKVRQVDIDLQEIENQLHKAGFVKNFVITQGWPFVVDNPQTEALFLSWRGE